MILGEPSDKQVISMMEADARLNIWDGSVRSGKTVASVLRWMQYVASDETEGPLAMIGKTQRTLRANIIDPLSTLVGKNDLRVSWGSGEAHLWGRLIYLLGANDERAEEKIRGGTYAGAYGDELSLWPASCFKMLLSRLSVRGAKLFGTTNPDSPRHWLKTGFLDRAEDLDLKRFHFTLEDNQHLDEGFVRALKTEYTGLWYKRFIEGLWVLAEGAIYSMLAEELHRSTDASLDGVRFHNYWVAIDYGTANPFVALVIGHGNDDRLHVLHEWRWDSRAQNRQRTDAEYSKDLREWLQELGIRPAAWICDPSALSFMQQLHRDKAGRIVAADNAVVDGIRNVSALLSVNRLTIHERCAATWDELAAYAWDDGKQLVGVDAPVKQDDHGPDAVRYGIRQLRAIWRSWVQSPLETAA